MKNFELVGGPLDGAIIESGDPSVVVYVEYESIFDSIPIDNNNLKIVDDITDKEGTFIEYIFMEELDKQIYLYTPIFENKMKAIS